MNTVFAESSPPSRRRFEKFRISVTSPFTVKRPETHFIRPGLIARAVNRLYGSLVSIGLGPSDSFLLLTKGPKTGMIHSTPFNILRFRDRLYLIGTRGHTQWSRNALAAAKVTLKRGRISLGFSLHVVPDGEKMEKLIRELLRDPGVVALFKKIHQAPCHRASRAGFVVESSSRHLPAKAIRIGAYGIRSLSG